MTTSDRDTKLAGCLGFAVVYIVGFLWKSMFYIASCGQFCSGTSTGSTSCYRVCQDSSYVIVMAGDLLLSLLLAGLMFVLVKSQIRHGIWLGIVLFLYLVYTALVPFVWNLPYFLSCPPGL